MLLLPEAWRASRWRVENRLARIGCRGPTPETHSCERSSDENRLHPYRRTQERCQLSAMAARRSQGLRRSEAKGCLSPIVQGHEGRDARHRKHASFSDWILPRHRAVSAIHGVEPDESAVRPFAWRRDGAVLSHPEYPG